jgi:hypothetical protein
MGVYPISDQRDGKERPSCRERKLPRGSGKVDGPGNRTPQEKPHPDATASRKSMDMTVGPEWEHIEIVRRRTRLFLNKYGFSREFIDAITMVGSELVENGIKYGDFGEPEKKLKFKLHILEKNIIVEVIHPTSASATRHLRRLDKTIQWIRGYQDPFQAYVEKLKEVARRPITDSESGLGLVRIAHEGKSILDFFIAEDNALNVSAVAGIEKALWR